MPGHIHCAVLCESPTVLIEDVRCRPACRDCGGEEVSTHPALAFIRAGAFIKHVGSHTTTADANTVLFFNPGIPYAVSHPVGGDDCVSFTFTERAVREVLREVVPHRSDRVASALLPDRALAEPRVALVYQQLRRLNRAGCLDKVAVDEIALDLLSHCLTTATTGRHVTHRPNRPGTNAAHRTLTENARMLLAERYRERIELATIARILHVSPFHLSRVFTRQVGWPIHKYLMRLRLRAALDALIQGHDDLTALALDLGFAGHSHLTGAFRAEFRITPSAARKNLGFARLRQMSKNLEVSPRRTR